MDEKTKYKLVDTEHNTWKVEINNAVVLELDKLNFVFVLNGKDMLAQIRSQC